MALPPYPSPPGIMPSPAEDAWRHRSAKMRCGTCMWFLAKEVGEDQAQTRVVAFGRCRRHAPVVQLGWPAVYAVDWCGDHKLDERHA